MSEKHNKLNLRDQWAIKLGIPADDPNFEYHLRDALASEDEAKRNSTLILTGFVKPEKKYVPLDKDMVPDWLQREK